MFMKRALTAAFAAALLLASASAPALAAGVRGDVGATVTGVYLGNNAIGAVSEALNWNQDVNFVEGTGANQADKIFTDRRTLSASASENLDLAGVLPDPFGVTLTFVTVKAIIIKAAAGNTNDVIVGGAGSNTFVGPFGAATHTAAVRPGGLLMFAAPGTGWTVTATTGDLLKVLNGGAGTSVTYDVIIIGTSA